MTLSFNSLSSESSINSTSRDPSPPLFIEVPISSDTAIDHPASLSISNLTQPPHQTRAHLTVDSKSPRMSVPPINGVYHLPVPGSKSAPKKFKGKFSEVKPFIKHYEKLCIQKGVTDDEERIQNISQYCSRSVREFMEGLTSYNGNNWGTFVQDLLEYYDAERDIKRYKRGDLEAFCKRMRHKKSSMQLSRWKSYNREFIRIAGWLVSRQKISEEEKALYFWKGIPHDFREKLEARLLAINPDHDLEEPFEIDKVTKVAKALLQRNRFDNDRNLLDDEDGYSSDSDDDEDSEDDSDDEDDERPLIRRRKVKSRSRERRNESAPKEPMVDAPLTKPATRSKTQEVEDLIQQMNRLSIHDPAYSVLYYRAYNLDPIIGDIMLKPLQRQQLSQRIIGSNSVMRSPPPNTNSNLDPVHQIPPHMKPGGNAFQTAPQPFEERKCFGCGGVGHTMFFCPELRELLNKGVVTKDAAGKYIMADGTFIRRMVYDEPLTTAIERLRPVQSNYIAVEVNPQRNTDNGSDSSDDESGDEPLDEVFIATRSMIKKDQSKRVRSDRVGVPIKNSYDRPRLKPVERTKAKEPEILPVPKVPTPITVDEAKFDPSDEDAFMEDTTQDNPPQRATPVLKKVPKRSEVQAQVDQMNVLGRILNQPVTLAIGEVFGISKEMTSNLREVLKPKPAAPNPTQPSESAKVNLVPSEKLTLASSKNNRVKETLIRLKMECDGRPVTAIIDTGSQLNIAHTRIWKTVFGRPLNTRNVVNMNDANGGESKLKGLVSHVPLTCGEVSTQANVYIGDQVPFDLLLGRPWQRGNFVSIDEREDGTYLLFKDKRMDVRHEILVTPEESVFDDPYTNEFISQARNAKYAVNLATVEEGEDESEMVRLAEEVTNLSLIPSKRQTTPPWNPRPTCRVRLSTSHINSDEVHNGKAESPRELCSPPTTCTPETENGEHLVKKTAIGYSEWGEEENHVETSLEEVTALDQGYLEKEWELMQVLTRTSSSLTKEGEKGIPWKSIYYRTFAKARKKVQPRRLLTAATDNARVGRIRTLIQGIRELEKKGVNFHEITVDNNKDLRKHGTSQRHASTEESRTGRREGKRTMDPQGAVDRSTGTNPVCDPIKRDDFDGERRKLKGESGENSQERGDNSRYWKREVERREPAQRNENGNDRGTQNNQPEVGDTGTSRHSEKDDKDQRGDTTTPTEQAEDESYLKMIDDLLRSLQYDEGGPLTASESL